MNQILIFGRQIRVESTEGRVMSILLPAARALKDQGVYTERSSAQRIMAHHSGEQIPLEARIFSLVDVWDAPRSDRPYRQAWSEEETLDYIQQQSGTHFDPQVVNGFFKVIRS